MIPENYQDLVDELLGEEVRAKRFGWDAEPSDDRDLSWKDVDEDEEEPDHWVTGTFGYLEVDSPRLPGVSWIPMVGNFPVDPDTIEATP